jgi:hypothetical protein
LLHAKTVHVGASPPRDLVDYPAAPSALAPTHVFCGNSAMNSARVPPRLVERGGNAELIEFMHLLRFFEFIMCPCGVNRSGRAEATATPRVQSALGRRAQSPSAQSGRPAGALAHGFCELKLFCDRPHRIAPEVPPSDAKLPLNCRLIDGFVGISATLMWVNPDASFCGMRFTGALWFRYWAIAAVVLRAQK